MIVRTWRPPRGSNPPEIAPQGRRSRPPGPGRASPVPGVLRRIASGALLVGSIPQSILTSRAPRQSNSCYSCGRPAWGWGVSPGNSGIPGERVERRRDSLSWPHVVRSNLATKMGPSVRSYRLNRSQLPCWAVSTGTALARICSRPGGGGILSLGSVPRNASVSGEVAALGPPGFLPDRSYLPADAPSRVDESSTAAILFLDPPQGRGA